MRAVALTKAIVHPRTGAHAALSVSTQQLPRARDTGAPVSSATRECPRVYATAPRRTPRGQRCDDRVAVARTRVKSSGSRLAGGDLPFAGAVRSRRYRALTPGRGAHTQMRRFRSEPCCRHARPPQPPLHRMHYIHLITPRPATTGDGALGP